MKRGLLDSGFAAICERNHQEKINPGSKSTERARAGTASCGTLGACRTLTPPLLTENRRRWRTVSSPCICTRMHTHAQARRLCTVNPDRVSVEVGLSFWHQGCRMTFPYEGATPQPAPQDWKPESPLPSTLCPKWPQAH